LTCSGPFSFSRRNLDGVIGLVKCGVDLYGPNRNSTDRFNVARMLDFTKNCRDVLGFTIYLIWENIIL
jgi:hypothetical protein